MIFTPEHCDMILRGEKTQTRRVAKPGETWEPYSEAVITSSYRLPLPHQMSPVKRVKWQVGKTYALQPGRGKSEVGRIRITDIQIELGVQCMHEDEIIAEGYSSIEEYALVWDSINTQKGTRWVDNPDVWVLTFELMADNLDSEG